MNIQSLKQQVTDLSIPIKQVKIPELTLAVRAVFEECAPELTSLEDPTKKFRLAVPNLQIKIQRCREVAQELNRERTIRAVTLAGGFTLPTAAVGAIYRVALGYLGIIGTTLGLAAGAVGLRYISKQLYVSDWSYQNSVEALETEIKNYKTFFSLEYCKLIEQAIRAKLQQMNDKEPTKPIYEKALVELKEQRGYIS
ncbi:MAG: hypothetical protein JSR37_01435 [Verrucomicrobia bacterium]|nr:hypothetical protein [Verrucomicrobiota bacterium]MBS0636688.1 hypothetical protein [Verrucomicrobiota bacterium]